VFGAAVAAVMLLAVAPVRADLSATCDGTDVSGDIHDYNDAIAAIQECAAVTNGQGKIAISMDFAAFMSLSNDYIPELTNYYSLARVGNGDATAGFFTQLCAYSEGISCTRASGSTADDEAPPVVAPRSGTVTPRVRGGRKLAQTPRNSHNAVVPRTSSIPRDGATGGTDDATSSSEVTTVYIDANLIQTEFAEIINGDLRLSADTTFNLESTADALAVTVDGMLEG
jgi:hypothetical protein